MACEIFFRGKVILIVKIVQQHQLVSWEIKVEIFFLRLPGFTGATDCSKNLGHNRMFQVNPWAILFKII